MNPPPPPRMNPPPPNARTWNPAVSIDIVLLNLLVGHVVRGNMAGEGGDATKLPPLRWPLQIPRWFLGFWPQKRTIVLIG